MGVGVFNERGTPVRPYMTLCLGPYGGRRGDGRSVMSEVPMYPSRHFSVRINAASINQAACGYLGAKGTYRVYSKLRTHTVLLGPCSRAVSRNIGPS